MRVHLCNHYYKFQQGSEQDCIFSNDPQPTSFGPGSDLVFNHGQY